jgi:hypothetical protein
MNSAAKSVYYFGIYLFMLSAVLITYPNILLTLFQIPETTEVWIRVVGVLVFSLGIYYVYMAITNHTFFMMITVYVRSSILLWFTGFVIAGFAPAPLILFGAVDFAAAMWTLYELKKLRD